MQHECCQPKLILSKVTRQKSCTRTWAYVWVQVAVSSHMLAPVSFMEDWPLLQDARFHSRRMDILCSRTWCTIKNCCCISRVANADTTLGATGAGGLHSLVQVAIPLSAPCKPNTPAKQANSRGFWSTPYQPGGLCKVRCHLFRAKQTPPGVSIAHSSLLQPPCCLRTSHTMLAGHQKERWKDH